MGKTAKQKNTSQNSNQSSFTPSPNMTTCEKDYISLGVSADMLLADVVDNGYLVKNTLLSEKMEKVSPSERNRIIDVVDTLLKHAQSER